MCDLDKNWTTLLASLLLLPQLMHVIGPENYKMNMVLLFSNRVQQVKDSEIKFN
jgi:hypothetical protein